MEAGEALVLPFGYELGQVRWVDPSGKYRIHRGESALRHPVTIKVRPIYTRDDKNAFLQESLNMKAVVQRAGAERRTGIIRLLDSFIIKRESYIVMEDYHFTLAEVLKDPERSRNIPTKERINYFYQVCCAMEEYALSKVAHLNVCLESLFVVDRHVKLGNFGHSLRYSSENSTSMKALAGGSLKPPEWNKPGGYNPHLVDLWGLGLLLHQLLEEEASLTIVNGLPNMDDTLPDSARELILSLLDPDPLARPSLLTVIGHNLFLQGDFAEKVEVKPMTPNKRKLGTRIVSAVSRPINRLSLRLHKSFNTDTHANLSMGSAGSTASIRYDFDRGSGNFGIVPSDSQTEELSSFLPEVESAE